MMKLYKLCIIFEWYNAKDVEPSSLHIGEIVWHNINNNVDNSDDSEWIVLLA